MLSFVVLCIILYIVAGSKNKKHLRSVLGRQYGPNSSIPPSKLRFLGSIDGHGPY